MKMYTSQLKLSCYYYLKLPQEKNSIYLRHKDAMIRPQKFASFPEAIKRRHNHARYHLF